MGRWIGGDGGPAILIQSSVIPHWRGAADFDKSLMNGGDLETDYDVICEAAEDSESDSEVYLLHRYQRDMLVLSDCEWVSRFHRLGPGHYALIQVFGSDKSVKRLIADSMATAPTETLSFDLQDPRLRLIVGADAGSGKQYGYSEIKLAPGRLQLAIYYSDEAQIVLFTSTGQA